MPSRSIIGMAAAAGILAHSAVAAPPTAFDFNDNSAAGWFASDPLAELFGPTTFAAENGRYTITSAELPPLPLFLGAGAVIIDSVKNPGWFSDGAVRATIRFNTPATNAYIAIRSDLTATSGYDFFLNNVQDIIGIDDLGSEGGNLEFIDFPLTENVDYRIEGRARGSQFSIKVWVAGEPEPAQPQITLTNKKFTEPGLMGFVVYNLPSDSGGEGGALSASLDDFTFTPDGWSLMDDFATSGLSDWSVLDLTIAGVAQSSVADGVAAISTSQPVAAGEGVAIMYNASADSPLQYADGTLRFIARAGNNRSALDALARISDDGQSGLAAGFLPSTGQMLVGEYTGAASTILGSAVIPVEGYETADWRLEFSFHADRVSLKAWPVGTPEPQEPQVTAAGATISAAGRVGFGVERAGASGVIEAACRDAWFKPLACRADFNDDGAANSQDFFDYLGAFFAGSPAADFNHDSFINSQDFFDFLAVFFAGCQ